MATELKQVIVVRADLKMPAGKIAAQVAHASEALAMERSAKENAAWKATGVTKIVVVCDSLEELEKIQKQARDAGLANYIVTDAGRTCFNNIPTKTCCAIGPGPAAEVDKITKKLKLC